MIKLFKSVDDKLSDLGFAKIMDEDADDFYGVSYARYIQEYGYNQRLDIMHKASGRHLIQSYQEDTNSDGYNNVVGLTYKETKLAMKKYRQMKRKYKW